MSDSVRPHRQQPTRLPHPLDSPGKNTGVGCHFLLQCMKVKSEREVAQSCPTLRDPMDCSLPGSSVHGIFQARVLEWGAITFSRKPLTISQIQYIQIQISIQISIKSNMDLISMNQRVSHKLFLLFMTHTFKAVGHPEGKQKVCANPYPQSRMYVVEQMLKQSSRLTDDQMMTATFSLWDSKILLSVQYLPDTVPCILSLFYLHSTIIVPFSDEAPKSQDEHNEFQKLCCPLPLFHNGGK